MLSDNHFIQRAMSMISNFHSYMENLFFVFLIILWRFSTHPCNLFVELLTVVQQLFVLLCEKICGSFRKDFHSVSYLTQRKANCSSKKRQKLGFCSTDKCWYIIYLREVISQLHLDLQRFYVSLFVQDWKTTLSHFPDETMAEWTVVLAFLNISFCKELMDTSENISKVLERRE